MQTVLRSKCLDFVRLVALVLMATPAFAARSRNTPNIDISGKWVAACHKSKRNIYVEETFIFDKDGSFTRDQRAFSDEDCATDALEEIKSYSGTYRVVGTAATIGNDGYKIDYKIDHVFDTAVGRESLSKFNESRLCNYTDWKAGEKRDITGLLCSGEVIKAGTVVYDILLKEDKKLYFGDPSFFMDVSKRKSRARKVDKKVAFDYQA